ncbi:MAG: hypothetical protein FWF03_03820, partial [Defluviitaleaceae bacterium]|nr:hypothetical protein [Defluviitaleaceae bacterium]
LGGPESGLMKADIEKYGGIYVLYGLRKNVPALQAYSVYRLDWLEEINFLPENAPAEIGRRVFFPSRHMASTNLLRL